MLLYTNHLNIAICVVVALHIWCHSHGVIHSPVTENLSDQNIIFLAQLFNAAA